MNDERSNDDSAKLSGGSLPKTVAAVWNEAHMRYLALRREYPGAGPEIRNFDNAWNVWSTNRPAPNGPDPLVYANRVLSFYEKAGSAAAAEHARALPALTQRALPAYWMIGADLARLAASIDATRPTASQRQDNLLATPIHTKDGFKEHIDLVAIDLAKIVAAIDTLRAESDFCRR